VVTDDLHEVLRRGLEAVRAAVDLASLDEARARFLGRGDGELTVMRRRIGTIADPDAKRQYGLSVNEACRRLEEDVEARAPSWRRSSGRRRSPPRAST